MRSIIATILIVVTTNTFASSASVKSACIKHGFIGESTEFRVANIHNGNLIKSITATDEATPNERLRKACFSGYDIARRLRGQKVNMDYIPTVDQVLAGDTIQSRSDNTKQEALARKDKKEAKNKAIKELEAQKSIFVAEMNRINKIFRNQAPEKVQVFVSRKLDDGTLLGTVNGELVGIQDYHGLINNVGVYQLEIVKLQNTLSRKLDNGFTQTISVYGVSTKGDDDYKEWKKTADALKLTKQYNTAKASSIDLQKRIDELSS